LYVGETRQTLWSRMSQHRYESQVPGDLRQSEILILIHQQWHWYDRDKLKCLLFEYECIFHLIRYISLKFIIDM
jgi:hypothetical protein